MRISDWSSDVCSSDLRRNLVQRLFHRRIAVAEPLLHQVDAQHRFQRVRATAAPGLGVRRFDPLQQRRPWRHLFHLSQKLFALGALALAGVFGVAKGHLRHRWVSRWLLRYSTKIDLRSEEHTSELQ